MAFSYVQVVLATCLPLVASAIFHGAFVVEYDENVQLVRRLCVSIRIRPRKVVGWLAEPG